MSDWLRELLLWVIFVIPRGGYERIDIASPRGILAVYPRPFLEVMIPFCTNTPAQKVKLLFRSVTVLPSPMPSSAYARIDSVFPPSLTFPPSKMVFAHRIIGSLSSSITSFLLKFGFGTVTWAGRALWYSGSTSVTGEFIAP